MVCDSPIVGIRRGGTQRRENDGREASGRRPYRGIGLIKP